MAGNARVIKRGEAKEETQKPNITWKNFFLTAL